MIYPQITGGEVIGAAGLGAAMVSLMLQIRARWMRVREREEVREEIEDVRAECRMEIGRLTENLEESKRQSQASMELLREGQLTVPARARALRMLRSGKLPEAVAAELGMARNEARLLQKVAAALAPRN